MCGAWAGPGDAAAPGAAGRQPRAGKATESAPRVGRDTSRRSDRHRAGSGRNTGRQGGNKACIALPLLCSFNCFNDLYLDVMLKSCALLLCVYLLYELFL